MLSLILKIILGGKFTMIDLYVALIVNHRRTINQVPAQFKDAVMADLTALGLDGNGNPIVTP